MKDMKVLDRLHGCGVVPVVVLDDVKDAVATAKALLAGGVDVMEITFRTAAAADSIKAARWRGHGHYARSVQTGGRVRRKVYCLSRL